MFMDSRARMRSVSEVNIKTKLRALVFGEDDRVINPGDILLEMAAEGSGDDRMPEVRRALATHMQLLRKRAKAAPGRRDADRATRSRQVVGVGCRRVTWTAAVS